MIVTDRATWLRQRQGCLAGTDLPRILGIGFDYEGGADSVYREKIAPEADDNDPNEDMLLGTALEEYVAQRFVVEANKGANSGLFDFGRAPLPIRVYEPASRLVRHPEEPWIGASVDRLLLGTDEPLECKTSKDSPGEDWGDTGTDIVPHRYMIQTIWQMHALRVRIGYVACSFRGWQTGFRWYRIDMDDELMGMLLDIAKAFWDRVQNRGGVDDWQHRLIDQAITRAARVVPFKGIMLPPAAGELAVSLERAAEQRKLANAEYDRCKGEALALLGDAERGMLPDGRMLVRQRGRESVRVVQRRRRR